MDAGVSRSAASYFQAYLGFASIVGQLGAGWLLDRVLPGRVVAGMLLLIAAACIIYTTPLAASLAVANVTVIGFMIGSEMNILGYMTKRHFGERAFGRIYGLTFSCFSLGGATGAQIFAFSRTALASYAPGLLFVAALCVVVAALFLRLGRPPYTMAQPASAIH